MSSNRLKLCPQCNGNIRTEYLSSSSLCVTSLWSINTCICALGDAGFRRYSLRFPAEKQKCNKNFTSYKLGPLNSYMPYLTLCHISHCEIKSHQIRPIWKPIPIRFFKSHRIFRPFYNTFYEEINTNHSLCLSQASYIKIKAFDYFGKSSKWFL